MPDPDLPENSVLKRHAESAEKDLPHDAVNEPPTDSVSGRHYEQMQGTAASASDSTVSPAPTTPAPGSELTFQEDGITPSNASIYKLLLWFAVLALIGVLVLYHWYTEKLKGDIAQRTTEVSESARQLSEANTRLGLFAENEKNLRSEMEAAVAQHQQEATKFIADLENSATAYAQLEGQHNAANQQIADLNSNVQRLEQDMAAAAQQHEAQLAKTLAQHQMRVQETEQRLGERVNYYRTALEGSEPERAEQLSALGQKIESVNLEIADARNTIGQLEATKVALDRKLAAAMLEVQQKQDALDQSQSDLIAIQEKLTQRQNLLVDLKTTFDKATAKAAQDLAASQGELRVANQSHATAMTESQTLLANTKAAATQAAAAAAAAMEKTKTEAATLLESTKKEAATAMQQATDDYTAQINAAEDKMSTLSQALESEKVALGALQEKYDTTVADLNAKLADTEQTLTDTTAKLSSTISAAAAAKEALEADIAVKQSRIVALEETIADERQQAAQELRNTQQKHNAALANLKSLHGDLSALGGTQTDQGWLLSLANTELRFRISGYELPRGDLPSLDRIAEFMNKYPNLSARIEGHTDNTGRDETNMELSYQRANAVVEALAVRGVNVERMTAEGIGANRPVTSNDTPAHRRRNRRVEIFIAGNY